MLDEDQLWGLTDDSGDVTEEAFDASRSLVAAVSHDVPVLKKRYLELVCAFADKVQKVQRVSDVTTRQLAVVEAKIGELEFRYPSLDG